MTEADKKEILETLNICSSYADDKCNGCPYDWMEDHGTDCRREMAEAALSLLKEQEYIQDRYDSLIIAYNDMRKEQEAVKPSWNLGKPFCGSCGLQIRGGKYCSECGKPIAWEGK